MWVGYSLQPTPLASYKLSDNNISYTYIRSDPIAANSTYLHTQYNPWMRLLNLFASYMSSCAAVVVQVHLQQLMQETLSVPSIHAPLQLQVYSTRPN